MRCMYLHIFSMNDQIDDFLCRKNITYTMTFYTLGVVLTDF